MLSPFATAYATRNFNGDGDGTPLADVGGDPLVHEEGNARGVLYRIFERRRYALIVVELLLHDLLFIEHVLSRTCGCMSREIRREFAR